MTDYFKYKDRLGPAWQHARKGRSGPSSSARDSERIRFEEKLSAQSFLSDTAKALARALYEWKDIRMLELHIDVALSDLSQALDDQRPPDDMDRRFSTR